MNPNDPLTGMPSTLFPGVKTTFELFVYESEAASETVTYFRYTDGKRRHEGHVPTDVYKYTLTKDTTPDNSKEYFVKTGPERDRYGKVENLTEFAAGTEYYERELSEEYKKDDLGIYTVCKDVIFRKTIDGNITRMEKAWDFWENRESAVYYPVNYTF